MAYITTVNKQTYRIEMGENDQQTQITLEGIAHTLDWRQVASLATDAKGNISSGGQYSLIIGGKSYDVFARRTIRAGQKDSETYEIFVAGQRFEVKVEDERAKLLAGLIRSASGSGEAIVAAPMPGLVVGVPVEQGAEVTEGQTVVVLEAMKMENDLSAPIAGQIKEIRVSKGQTVDQGEVLIVIMNSESA